MRLPWISLIDESRTVFCQRSFRDVDKQDGFATEHTVTKQSHNISPSSGRTVESRPRGLTGGRAGAIARAHEAGALSDLTQIHNYSDAAEALVVFVLLCLCDLERA